jgi:protein-S-isoprenylcysteine O-methyltransferase Ste14
MSRLAKLFLLVITPVLAILLALLGIMTVRFNPMGWFLILSGSTIAAGVVIVYYFQRQRFWESALGGATTQEERGDRSFWLITLSLMAATYLPPVEYLYFPIAFPRPNWIAAGGMVLVTLGTVLFVWARSTLRKNYSGRLTVKTDQTLVQSGPYRVIRHPAYAGYLLMVLGFSLGYASLAGLITILGLVLPSLVYRMRMEEKLLIEHFGEAYRQYALTTKRLIPGIM